MSSALAKRIKYGRYVNDNDQRQEEFIAIGYGCTIFRDDEKVDFLNEERHLISHPCDDSVTMDRYDARLHLHDLDLYDAAKADRTGGHNDGDVEESELEFERYRDLMAANDDEEPTYGSNISSAVEFANDSSNGSRSSSPFADESGKDGQQRRRKDQIFVAPPELELPPEVTAPKTIQSHAIIAKTATFVAAKGAQMEIVIKAKQKNQDNHFGFLDFDNPMRPYYDHVLTMIKRGRYQFTEPEEDESDEDEGGDYLHPSLMASASSSSSLAQKAKLSKVQRQEKQEDEKSKDEQPSVDLQPIIDRLAEYVARNGDAFENVVRSRNDPLYQFIEPQHEFYAYYRQRVDHYRNENRQKAAAKAAEIAANISQSIRASASSPALTSASGNQGKTEKQSSQRSQSPSSRSSKRRSKDGSSDEDRGERQRSRDRKRSRRSRSRDDEGGEIKKKMATFVPVPSSDEQAKKTSSAEASPQLDAGDEKIDVDEAARKLQEERRAKAKIFLKLIKDRDQTASKVVNPGTKPWDDD